MDKLFYGKILPFTYVTLTFEVGGCVCMKLCLMMVKICVKIAQ